jgi:hypothetical protein
VRGACIAFACLIVCAAGPVLAGKRKHKPTTPAVEPAAPAPTPGAQPASPPRSSTQLPDTVESELIKQGVAAYDDLDYDKAIELLNKALGETLTRDEKIVTYRTLGFCHAALNQMTEARSDFQNLLKLDRDSDLDRTVAPRVRVVFEEAKSSIATGQAQSTGGSALPGVMPTVDPARPVEGRPLTIRVEYLGGMAERLVVFHRARGQAVYSRVDAHGDEGGHFVATVPATAVKAPGVEYYLDLTDERGVTIARGGSLGAPLDVDVLAYKKPIYKRGWFWGVLGGVVAVGAGVAAAVILTRPTIAPNAPATVTIQPF